MPSDRPGPRSRPRWPARAAPDRSHATPGAVDLGLVVRDAAKSSSSWCRSSKPSSVEGGVRVGVRRARSRSSRHPRRGRSGSTLPSYSLVASGGTGSPAYAPVCRSRSRAPCKITTAAAWSTTARRFLPLRPCAPQLPLGSHGAQALVAQPDRDRLRPGWPAHARTSRTLPAEGPSPPDIERGRPT